eukprot:TRINITY_DN2547_c0_g1_i3.p1 TRINITY_DN2547_c0_g1~~TRINITY_DN2547_c0_g1_i3.p1  ORF type:complete len:438 (-),score=51.22 TRINITY_DN2547_c0_g1_i3:80-1393(-)
MESIAGTIPTQLGLMTSLANVQLELDLMTGSLPTEIGLMSSLSVLVLDTPKMTGPIPTEVGQLSQLGSIRINAASMDGTIPTEIGQLDSLRELYVTSELITGIIPTEIGQMDSLEDLFIGAPYINGTLPTEIGQLEKLKWFAMELSSLTGSIPTQIGHMSSLNYISWNVSLITGTIPTEVKQLTSLSTVYLRSNNLTGECWPFLLRDGSQVEVEISFKCGCDQPGTFDVLPCYAPPLCEVPDTTTPDKCLTCTDGAYLTKAGSCEEITGGCAMYGCGTGICADLTANQRMCTCSKGDWIVGGPFEAGIILDGSSVFTGCSSDLEVDNSVEIAQHVLENPSNLLLLLNRQFPRISDVEVVRLGDAIKVRFRLSDTNTDSLQADIGALAKLWSATAEVESLGNDRFTINFFINEIPEEGSSVFVIPSLLSALFLAVALF